MIPVHGMHMNFIQPDAIHLYPVEKIKHRLFLFGILTILHLLANLS